MITLLFLTLGDRAGALLPPALPRQLGGWLLVGLGLWSLLDWLRELGRQAEEPKQLGGSGTAWLSLAAALGVNNAGAGLRPEYPGSHPYWVVPPTSFARCSSWG